ncbi:MAG: tRNA uridine-5-carboxymethylaminomethyl(34) synthesis GTPase MnmE [Flavobacteriaceae bacterium]
MGGHGHIPRVEAPAAKASPRGGESNATIVARATAPGKAGVAVLRASGPAAFALASALTRLPLPVPRQAAMRRFLDPVSGETIDEGLLLLFPGPSSYTGEDIAEFQVHGGTAVAAALLAAMQRIGDVRLAEPGEFTRRAFSNGRQGLTEIEGLAALIDSETESQRRLARAVADGKLERSFAALRAGILDIRATLESEIDFSDEGDVPEADGAAICTAIARLRDLALDMAGTEGRGRMIAEGYRVVLAGPPNVGKSSLLNALAGRDVAIVSEIPGTTRDRIEARLDLGGYLVVVTDTAGLRDTDDPVEREGVRRSVESVEEADLVLRVFDEPHAAARWDAGERELVVLNKGDLFGMVDSKAEQFVVSAKTGAGLDALLAEITRRLDSNGEDFDSIPVQVRHAAILREVAATLTEARDHGERAEWEFCSDRLRAAGDQAGSLIGLIGVEDVLSAVFSRFCIGK